MHKKYIITVIEILFVTNLVYSMDLQKKALLYRGKTNPNLSLDSVLEDNKLRYEEELTQFVSQTLSPSLQDLLHHVRASSSFEDFTPKTLLLEGEAGAGKSLTSQVFAHQTGKNYTYVSSALIADEFEDTVERALEMLKAKMGSGQHIIIFDSIGSLTYPEHESVFKKFLEHCFKSNKFIIGTAIELSANFREFFSRGRKSSIVPIISASTDEMRKKILLVHLSAPHNIDGEAFEKLVRRLGGSCNRSLQKVAGAAHCNALYRNKDEVEITLEDFNQAIQRMEDNRRVLGKKICHK